MTNVALTGPETDGSVMSAWQSHPWEDPASYVEGLVRYLASRKERPVSRMGRGGGRGSRRTAQYVDVAVPVHDARQARPVPTLDREGFELARHTSAVSNYFEEEEVRNLYYPEIERFVAARTGAARVVAFDHNVRVDTGDGDLRPGVRAPVRIAHNDYTERSAPRRVRDLFPPEEAEAFLAKRFAVINVWKPIQGPVLTAPLALLDARSALREDLVLAVLEYEDRTGEIYELAYNPSHRWFTYPRMETHEALLIKGYDSLDDGRARITPHTSFVDPSTPPGAPPRESIEVRTFAFFDT